MIPLGAWPRTAAGRIAQDLEFVLVVVPIFFALCAAWWSFSVRSGRLTARHWRVLFRLTGGAGLGALAMLAWFERGDILTAAGAAPLGVGLVFAAECGCFTVLLIFPWKWGAEPDASLPFGLDIDSAPAPPPPPRAGTRVRLTVANAYAWLIVAAVAYIGVRWLLHHL